MAVSHQPVVARQLSEEVRTDRQFRLRSPCIAIVIAVIGVNLFGEGLKDILLAKGSRRKEAKI